MVSEPTDRRHRRALLYANLVVAFLCILGLAALFLVRGTQQRLPDSTISDSVPTPKRMRNPVIFDVVAQFPGASAEEVERQVTIPLEVTFAGMPRCERVSSKSIFGLAQVQLQFDIRADRDFARQEIINRLATIAQPLPQGVNPQISSAYGPALLRYTLNSPKDPLGRDIYTLNDLKALQDWGIEREFRTVPGVIDVVSFGGTIRRYDIQPDPDRLRRYGVTLAHLENALINNNKAVAGDFLNQGQVALRVRSVGLFGGGQDPTRSKQVREAKDPVTAAAFLRAEEQRRLNDIRQTVIAAVNNVPVKVEDVVAGGRILAGDMVGEKGVVVGHQPRLGRICLSRFHPELEENDKVEGIVLMRPGEDPHLVLKNIQAKIKELNDPASGRLLPGVQIETYLATTDPSQVKECFSIQGDFPSGTTLDTVAAKFSTIRTILGQFPEVEAVLAEIGRPEDGNTAGESNCVQYLVRLGGDHQARSKPQLMDNIIAELDKQMPGVVWTSLSDCGCTLDDILVPDNRHSLQIVGPDLDELERLATLTRQMLKDMEGIKNLRVPSLCGQKHFVFRVDPEKCAKWGVTVAEVNTMVQCVLGGKLIGQFQLVEGERLFDIALSWPIEKGKGEEAILDLPVDLVGNVVPFGQDPALKFDPAKPNVRIRLRDLVLPIDDNGAPDPNGQFLRPGATAIYREQGKRLVPIRFDAPNRKLNEIKSEISLHLGLKAGYFVN
jgi:Cu/Ag efflux pump CusA